MFNLLPVLICPATYYFIFLIVLRAGTGSECSGSALRLGTRSGSGLTNSSPSPSGFGNFCISLLLRDGAMQRLTTLRRRLNIEYTRSRIGLNVEELQRRCESIENVALYTLVRAWRT